jgi:predicted TIM-barrel fold metal-dependent hydrolase
VIIETLLLLALTADRPKIIDVHAHLDAGAVARIARIMDNNGIEVMVNLSGGNLSRGIRRTLALERALPGRIISFYTPDWSDINEPWWGAREAHGLEVAVQRFGFVGLKISKALGLFLRDPAGRTIDVDDPRLDMLWERAGQLGVPVAIHTGDPKAFWEPNTPHNERYAELGSHPGWSFHGEPVPSREELLAARDRMLERHMATTFICVHFGNNPEDAEYVGSLLERYPNAYVDIAARVPEIGRHPAKTVKALFERFQDRILFGTDIGISQGGIMLGSTGEDEPTEADADRFYDTHWRFFETNDRGFAHPTPIQGDWTIDAIGLSPAVLQKIYRDNAIALGLGPPKKMNQ